MEEWDDKNVRAHINFRVSLEGARLDYLLGSKEELQRLRHDYASLTYEIKLLKYVLKHRGIDLEQEVIDRTMPKCMPKMSPKGGEWDEEDDEKQSPGKDPARDDSSLSSVESEPIDPVAALRAKRLARFANM